MRVTWNCIYSLFKLFVLFSGYSLCRSCRTGCSIWIILGLYGMLCLLYLRNIQSDHNRTYFNNGANDSGKECKSRVNISSMKRKCSRGVGKTLTPLSHHSPQFQEGARPPKSFFTPLLKLFVYVQANAKLGPDYAVLLSFFSGIITLSFGILQLGKYKPELERDRPGYIMDH